MSSTDTRRQRADHPSAGAGSLRERQDQPLIRRHAAVEGVEIGPLNRRRSAVLDHFHPLIQLWGEGGPCGAKPFVETARTPILGALADMIGGEEPARLGARQFWIVGRRAAMSEPDAAGIFHVVAEMPVQLLAQ